MNPNKILTITKSSEVMGMTIRQMNIVNNVIIYGLIWTSKNIKK